MGCFSFICQTCGRGIRSNSSSGEKCHLFLLKKGKVIQKMSGEYDSYGRLFKDSTKKSSEQWGNPSPEPLFTASKDPEKKSSKKKVAKKKIIKNETLIWGRIVDLIYDDDFSNGIAAFHDHCYNKEVPSVRSESDPNQGWGNDDSSDYMDNISKKNEYPPLPAIPGYNPLVFLKKNMIEENIRDTKKRIENKKLLIPVHKLGKNKTSLDATKKSITKLKKQIKELEEELIDILN